MGLTTSWEWEALECYTRLSNITLSWQYPSVYQKYVVKKVNQYTEFPSHFVGTLQNVNQYTLNNLANGKVISWRENYYQMENPEGQMNQKMLSPHNDIYYEFYMKPVTNLALSGLDYQNKFLKLIYRKNLSADLICTSNLSFTKTSVKPVNADKTLSDGLKGHILLQVDAHGEAYYVNPKDSKRYYMADGNEAYRVMRYLGVGITNSNLQKIKTDKAFAKKNSGKIFLQVESLGEAYYIDFNGVAHYLKDGSAAYTIMRELGLGITNNDLSKILEGSL